MRASEEMTSAVHSSFGPNGRAVLAQSTTRLVITRSGWQILNLVFPSRQNPTFAMLLESIDQFHDVSGDGVKSFVIIVKALLNQVALKNARCFVNKLLTLQSQLFNSSFGSCECVLTNDTLNNVIRTFFTTRFSPVVSETLLSLVSEWLLKLSSVNDVSIYVSNFTSLCLKLYPFPITASSIQSGFLIKGLQANRLPRTKSQCELKVYYCPTENVPEDGDIEMEVTEILGKDDFDLIVLFVTNIVLQDRAQYILNIRGIFFVHGVCLDTIKFLSDHSLSSGKVIVDYRYINDYLWISLPVYQLMLKAPSAALASEYSEGVLDCLKMLHFSFKDSPCTVPAGGLFEHALAKKLFHLTQSTAGRLPPVESREQLLAWSRPLPDEAGLLRHINISVFNDMDSQTVDIVCRALLCLRTAADNDETCLEPVALRLAILSKAISTTVSVCKIGGAIYKRKKGRLF